MPTMPGIYARYPVAMISRSSEIKAFDMSAASTVGGPAAARRQSKAKALAVHELAEQSRSRMDRV